jgi:hypothetical protein
VHRYGFNNPTVIDRQPWPLTTTSKIKHRWKENDHGTISKIELLRSARHFLDRLQAMKWFSGPAWRSPALFMRTCSGSTGRRAKQFSSVAKPLEGTPRFTYAAVAFFAGTTVGASAFLFGLVDLSRKAPLAKWKEQDDVPAVRRRYADKTTMLMVT